MKVLFEELARNFPILRPSYANFDMANKDFIYSSQIRQLLLRLSAIQEAGEEHALCAERLAYQYLLDFYRNAQQSVSRDLPGTDSVLDALAPLFARPGRK